MSETYSDPYLDLGAAKDIVFSTAGVERGRIKADGTGSGLLGGPLLSKPVSAPGDYTANSGEIVVGDLQPSGHQTITLPTTFSLGDKVAVVRGLNTGSIDLVPGAGATISGTALWRGQAPNTAYIAVAQGESQLVVVAVSPTLWVPLSAVGFYPQTSGFAQVFNDLWITGTAFFNFQWVMSNVATVSSAANLDQSSSVVLATGTGGYSLTFTGSSTGQMTFIKNNSSGNVTVVPNGVGTIDGAASLVLAAGAGCLLLNLTGNANSSWTRLL